jgi:transmembrane sensor
VEQRQYDIDDVIGKYLSGEATEDERLFVEKWISGSAGNKRYFEHLKTIFTKAAAVSGLQDFDPDAAWEKMRSRLATPHTRSVPFKPGQRTFDLFLKIAASVIVISAIGFGMFRYFSAAPAQLTVVAETKPRADTLPDGTAVFLNKTSRLVYNFDKKQGLHVVKLKGEAYFNIRHTDHPFVIEVDKVHIKDIGTSFNVRAFPDSYAIEVFVEEGQVQFYSDGDPGVTVGKNEKGLYDRKTGRFSIAAPDMNETSYKTRSFVFNDRDLQTVVNTLNEVYETRIVIGDSLKHCRLSVNFNDESTEEISAIIAETLGVKVRRSGNEFILEGPGCPK